MRILSGNANRPLAEAISHYLDVRLTQADVRRFNDKEIYVEIQENVRGEDVFLIQPTSYPANDHLMELLVAIDALRRGSAGRITAVIPYYGYARQDQKSSPRSPISARLVANLIETAGADRVLTLDLHAGQIQGFFDIPTDNLFAAPMFAQEIRRVHRDDCSNVMNVRPDVGGVVRARAVAKAIEVDLAIIDKRRPKAGLAEVMNVIGDVEGKHCILIDDIVDTAGTLCKAAEALVKNGAISVSAYATHGVLSGPAVANIDASEISDVVVTDSIQPSESVVACEKIRAMSISELMGEAIRRVSNEESVSTLFNI